MPSSRETLGLLLPLPALLLAGPAQARVDPPPSGEEPAATPEAASSEAVPPPRDPLGEVQALYQQGRQAYDAGRYLEAGQAFERAAALAPALLELHLDAALAFRKAALAEDELAMASEPCDATRRNAKAVVAHPLASPEQIDQAREAQQDAEIHCRQLRETREAEAQAEAQAHEASEAAAAACLSRPAEPYLGPCLNIVVTRRGCGHRSDDGSMATVLGTLSLLGLRSRRRRDAVDRLAERLPPDVVAKLRRTSDDEPGDDR